MDGVHYRFVVEGELGPRYASAFEGMQVTSVGGRTVILGMIKDQAHLHGLLERIASLGINLISVTPVDGQETMPFASDQGDRR